MQAERAGILQQRQVYSAEAAVIEDEIRAAREEIETTRETLNQEAEENRERRQAQLESLNSQKNASLEAARGHHAEQATANQEGLVEARVALESANIESKRVEGPDDARALVNDLRDQIDGIKDSLVGARNLVVTRTQESVAARERFTLLGARQGRCRLIHAAKRCFSTPSLILLGTAISRSGLSVTVSIGDQSRVSHVQRRGLRSRA